MPESNRTRLLTVADDNGAVQVYWARSADDHALDWRGEFLFHADGSVTFKARTDEDAPIVTTIFENRVLVAVTDDQVGATEDTGWPLGEVLLDTADLRLDLDDTDVEVFNATVIACVEEMRELEQEWKESRISMEDANTLAVKLSELSNRMVEMVGRSPITSLNNLRMMRHCYELANARLRLLSLIERNDPNWEPS